MNQSGGIAIMIWDCCPVYGAREYDLSMNDAERYNFAKEWLALKHKSTKNLVKHTFTDGVEMYFSPHNRNKCFMEAVLLVMGYSDEYPESEKVTSPTIF